MQGLGNGDYCPIKLVLIAGDPVQQPLVFAFRLEGGMFGKLSDNYLYEGISRFPDFAALEQIRCACDTNTAFWLHGQPGVAGQRKRCVACAKYHWLVPGPSGCSHLLNNPG